MKRIVALAAVLVMVAVACGGDDSGADLSSDDQALADAIAEGFLEGSGSDAPFGAQDAQCFGDRIVSEMGASRLVSLGLSAADIGEGASPSDVDLSDADVVTMASVMTECIDFKAAFVDEFKNQGISDDSATCLADGLDDDFVMTMAIAALRDDAADPFEDAELGEAMFALITQCMSFEELQQLGS